MNNLITFIKRTKTQKQIISLLRHNDIFNYVRNYLMEYYDIDFDGTEFIDEQNVLSVRDVQLASIEAIKMSLR